MDARTDPPAAGFAPIAYGGHPVPGDFTTTTLGNRGGVRGSEDKAN